MEKMDYRIGDFSSGSSLRREYNLFLKDKAERVRKGLFNEFEPRLQTINEIEEALDFKINRVLVFFFPYMTREKLMKSKNSNLSYHAYSKDYHPICKNLMEGFFKDISKPNVNYYIQSDNGFFNERFFAINIGLCAQGVNSMAIHPQYGSFGFLGLIMTDMELKVYQTEKSICRRCNRCIEACPTKTINEESFQRNLCFSYLTQKKDLSEKETLSLKKHDKVFGCDSCQTICPENFNIIYSKNEDFTRDLLYNIGLEEIDSISNREFKRLYADRNFSWRGKNILKRNIGLIEKDKNE